MKIKGWDLDFFNSGEWQVCDERLQLLQKQNRPIGLDGFNPGRKKLFNALRATPFSEVSVAIIGQDPYPSAQQATGIAFDCGSTQVESIPTTLQTIFREYSKDLGYPTPQSGDLSGWYQQGVLLWNAIPSCATGRSMSHDWPEWECLTREIVTKLSTRGIVFAFLGQVARRFVSSVSETNNKIITTGHPSPRGLNSKSPFVGSRLFSTINDKLVSNGQEAIGWRLP